MTNTLPFLPIELQNLIFSYTRPVYPYIKELKEKEEERQKEIDRKIKKHRKRFMRNINYYFSMYEGDVSLNMFIRNSIYMSKVYSYRYRLTGDTDEFIWSWEIAHSGGSINYFKKLKRLKRGKEIEKKFKFMVDYYNTHNTTEEIIYDIDADEDLSKHIKFGLEYVVRYSTNEDYIMEMKRQFGVIKGKENLKDCVNRINRLNLFRSKREMWRNLNMKCNLKLIGVRYRIEFRRELEKRFKC